MNIYEKMQNAKEEILKANLKKSGTNKFANYTYYSLADILPTIVTVCNKLNLFTKVSFEEGIACLYVINTEKPEEVLEYNSPMKDIEMKGCNPIQALGGVETYSRRYLYMAAFDISETDMFDGNDPKENESPKIENKENVSPAKTLNTNQKASQKQIELIKKYYRGQIEGEKGMLNFYGIEQIEDLSMEEASNLIAKKIGGRKQ